MNKLHKAISKLTLSDPITGTILLNLNWIEVVTIKATLRAEDTVFYNREWINSLSDTELQIVLTLISRDQEYKTSDEIIEAVGKTKTLIKSYPWWHRLLAKLGISWRLKLVKIAAGNKPEDSKGIPDILPDRRNCGHELIEE